MCVIFTFVHTKQQHSYFLFTATDICYTDPTPSVEYAGDVNYATDMFPCLPWDEVDDCPWGAFDPK